MSASLVARSVVLASTLLLWAAPAQAQLTDQAQRQLDYCWSELEEGEFDRARKSAESALRLDPGLYDAMICKAEVYLAQDDLVRARTVVGAYLELRPGLAPSERATALMERLGIQADGTIVEPEPASPEEGDEPAKPDDADRAPKPQTGAWKSWDPAVYGWAKTRAGGNFTVGGIGLGLLIAGDQIATLAATNQGVRGRSSALSSFITVNHLPLGTAEETFGSDWALGYFGEFFFSAGLIMTVPGLLGPIPHLVLATLGQDLRTVKAAAGIGGGAAFLASGVVALVRLHWLYSQEWENQQFGGERFHFIIPGAVNLVAGIGALSFGVLDLLSGVLYATGAVEAKVGDEIFPTAMRLTPPRVTPWFAANERGGSVGVLLSWREL